MAARHPHPIRYILLQRGLKLVDLARDTGVEYQTLRRAINGEFSVRRDIAERAAEAVGLPVPALFRMEDVRDEVGVQV